MDEGKSAEAKVLWAEFPTIEPNAGLIIDLHGTEHSRFVAQYNNSWLHSTLKAECENCHHKLERSLKGLILHAANGDISVETEFETMFYRTVEPLQDVCRQCDGRQVWRCRVFDFVPPFLILEVPQEELLKMSIIHLEDLPPLLILPRENFMQSLSEDPNVTSVSYILTGATYANGVHFRGAFLSCCEKDVSQHGWYSYDSLSERKLVGPLPPQTLPGSNLSYVIYSALQSKYEAETICLMEWLSESSLDV